MKERERETHRCSKLSKGSTAPSGWLFARSTNDLQSGLNESSLDCVRRIKQEDKGCVQPPQQWKRTQREGSSQASICQRSRYQSAMLIVVKEVQWEEIFRFRKTVRERSIQCCVRKVTVWNKKWASMEWREVQNANRLEIAIRRDSASNTCVSYITECKRRTRRRLPYRFCRCAWAQSSSVNEPTRRVFAKFLRVRTRKESLCSHKRVKWSSLLKSRTSPERRVELKSLDGYEKINECARTASVIKSAQAQISGQHHELTWHSNPTLVILSSFQHHRE